jgi:glycosyltransferase involved in cell wall biosynthesis
VIPPRKAYLFFHWVNLTPGKREFFRKAALRQPHLVLLGPTPTVTGIFRECGFADVETAPYPVSPTTEAREGEPFRHLLYAGAARQDKGFGRIVDLVAHLSSLRLDLPVAIQTSPDHYDRYDARTRSDLKRLESLRYPFLRVFPGTLDPGSYAELFRGGICLQPYRREEFTDRVSGVMLDALSAGCPVIATEGTWMARAVRRFDAGLPVEDLSPESLLAAARAVIGAYGRYSENAAAAGRALQQENSARHLYELLAAS